jgi:pimeloyl-ACP methyl ester carboxylesterase
MDEKLILKNIFPFILILLAIFFSSRSYTPPFLDSENKQIKDSVSELIKVRLGGYKQSLLIRGIDKKNPIIIFLHGGPGYPCISYIRKYQTELEKHFVVVNWDQRGSGRSFSPFIPIKSMTKEQLISDLDDLVNYIRKRFNASKVIIVGHSWGTVLGISYIQRYPEKVLAYVGIGQVVNNEKSEQIGYQFTTEQASKRRNEKAIRELEDIGSPPYPLASRKMAIQRKWLNKYGGNEISVISRNEILKGIFFSPEYSLIDGAKFFLGNVYSVANLYKYLEDIDFLKSNRVFSIPIYFCIGSHDFITPGTLVEEYYKQLSSPKKGIFWFSKSGHEPQLDEKDRFAEVMNEIVASIQ